MRALLLLHSATGNTRLVARYAAARLGDHGFDTRIHDLGRDPSPPSLRDVDVVGVAFPTMYFWPTIPILRAIDALPRPDRAVPSFVLSTAAGDPGGALSIAVERLQAAGYPPIGAHWVLAPSNWPQHVWLSRLLDTTPVVRRLNAPVETAMRAVWRRAPALRPWLGMIWVRACETLATDRDALDRFVVETAGRARAVVEHGAPATPPDLRGQYLPALERVARRYTPDIPAGKVGLRVLPDRCTRCGACEATCPTGCVVTDDAGLPRFTDDCVGCYACYNHCAHGAIRGVAAPAARGRYAGPPAAMRRLLRPARTSR